MNGQQKSGILHAKAIRSCSSRGRGCPNSVVQGEIDWHTLVRHYRAKYLPNHCAEIQWFEGQSTLAAAIAKAAFAEDDRGRRYSHQRRIQKNALKTSFQALRSREDAIRRCRSFDELHELILNALKNVSGIGELYCYDTALRIGAKCRLRPRTVLLHAGTRAGASVIADTRGKGYLTKKDLPAGLRHLPPEQIEDILCIYKDEIERCL
jgi:hypothetical protein